MFFGAHVSVSGGYGPALDYAQSVGCECIQIFAKSPRQWRGPSLKPELAERFVELRRARADYLGLPPEPYASLEAIRQEIHFAENMCKQHSWRRIDVTGKSVEEVAQEILTLCCLP